MDTVLKVSNISKTIKKKEIIRDISFALKKGEILGFLGTNGAGKSTTLRMLVGLSRPSVESISICGHSIDDDYVVAMRYVGCIIEAPDLLILDEPTNGLDPQGTHEFREIVKSLAGDEGISILISSHLIGEVQLMCDRVCIINNGVLIREGSVAEMLSSDEIIWVLNDPPKGQKILKDRFKLKSLINVQNELIAKVDLEILPRINETFIASGLNLQTVSTKKKTLEDLFLSFTNQQAIQ